MTTLREARKGKLDQFIKEHETDPTGDLDNLDASIKRPIRETVKAVPKASSRAECDG